MSLAVDSNNFRIPTEKASLQVACATWLGRAVKRGGQCIAVALAIISLVMLFPLYLLTLCQWNGYRQYIAQVIQLNYKWQLNWDLSRMTDFLAEPLPAIKAGIDLLRTRLCKQVMNPTVLRREQLLKRPILLIPGSNGRQGYFYTLAKKLSSKGLGPVFSLNLQDPYPLTPRDFDAVKSKITEISELYEKHGIYDVQIDIIGYSRGANMAKFFILQDDYWSINSEGTASVRLNLQDQWASKNIHKIIQLGYPVSKWWQEGLPMNMLDRLYDIDGKEDLVVTDRSTLQEGHKFEASCGHLGLLQNAAVHDKIADWLSD